MTHIPREVSHWSLIIKRIFVFYLGQNCTQPAIDDFPDDIFTLEQRQAGAIAFHIFVSLYLFLALAVVCDKYFVPAVEKICTSKIRKCLCPLPPVTFKVSIFFSFPKHCCRFQYVERHRRCYIYGRGHKQSGAFRERHWHVHYRR